jgi:hypothetical protein
MFWIAAAVLLCVGMAALVAVSRAKRPGDLHDLGSVSAHWVAEHQAESR